MPVAPGATWVSWSPPKQNSLTDKGNFGRRRQFRGTIGQSRPRRVIGGDGPDGCSSVKRVGYRALGPPIQKGRQREQGHAAARRVAPQLAAAMAGDNPVTIMQPVAA